MLRFDFALKYVAGKSMGRADNLSKRADNLSKRADWAEEVEKDNKNQIMLKKEWLEIRVMDKRQVLIEGVKEDIVKKIKNSKARDDEVIKVVEEIKKAEVKVLRNEEWQIENNLVLKEGKIYILRDEKLRLEIIWLHHNMPIAGHGG